jgi:hypothetical protein
MHAVNMYNSLFQSILCETMQSHAKICNITEAPTSSRHSARLPTRLQIGNPRYSRLEACDTADWKPPSMRIPMKADTCSNPYRTPFRACRTVVGAKRRSEGLIKGCPTGVKVLPPVLRSFGAPLRGDDPVVLPRASSRRLFGRAVSGGNGLSNPSSRCRRSLRVTDSPARPNRRACD